MEINYYLKPNAQGYDESWEACQFTCETDLTHFRCRDLVTINGQPYLRQHHVTYLTGKETCRAHHFAKHLAIQLLSKEPSAPSGDSRDSSPSGQSGCTVLWIDTVNGPHVSAAIFRELLKHVSNGNDLRYLCLDVMGGKRDDHWWLSSKIESLINELKPQLVVIDDIDHFMPYCGSRLARDFSSVVRDTINHTDAAFLFIGYNHTGKKACTAGELGKQLFYSSNDIFSLSTVREVTTVRHISGYDLHVFPGDSQFHFTIGTDNLPQETLKPAAKPASGIGDDTLRDIVQDIIQPGQDITTGELLAQVKARHAQLKRDTRDAALLDQIHRLHLLIQHPAGYIPSSHQVLNPLEEPAPKDTPEGSDSGTSHALDQQHDDSKDTPEGSDSGTSHALSKQHGDSSRQQPQPASQCSSVHGDAIAVKDAPAPKSEPAPKDALAPSTLAVSCAAAQQRPPQDQEINNSLTLPTHHHQHPATCPMDGGSAPLSQFKYD